MDLEEFRTIDVELIWTRFETDRVRRYYLPTEENEETLSVCLVISWPATHLVARVDRARFCRRDPARLDRSFR